MTAINGVNDGHAQARHSRARRELSEFLREDAKRTERICTALRDAEHIPPDRIPDYLRLLVLRQPVTSPAAGENESRTTPTWLARIRARIRRHRPR